MGTARVVIGALLILAVLGSCALSTVDIGTAVRTGGGAAQITELNTSGTYFVVAAIGVALGAYLLTTVPRAPRRTGGDDHEGHDDDGPAALS